MSRWKLGSMVCKWLISYNLLINGHGVGFKYVLFSPLFGEDFQLDEHIFQMGGSTTNQFVSSPRFLVDQTNYSPAV